MGLHADSAGDPTAIQALVEGLIPGCRRTNPRLFHRIPHELRSSEALIAAAPLYPNGSLLLTDQRLLSFDRPLSLARGELCEAIELASVHSVRRDVSRHSTKLTLTLASSDGIAMVLSWGGRKGDDFGERLAALARDASGTGPAVGPGWAPPRPDPPPPPPPPPPAESMIGAPPSAPTIPTSDPSPPGASPARSVQDVMARTDALATEAAGVLTALRREWEARDGRIRNLTKAVEEAARGRKLGAIGAVQRVVLYEDRVTTPDGTFELAPGVHARCELEGAVQSVQGWIWKSDQDRREVYLHINGPGWHSVVRWNMKWTVNQPKTYIEMAYAIGQAANRAEDARAEIEERLRGAEDDLLSEIGELRGIEERSAGLASLRLELLAAVASLETALADARDGEASSRGVLRRGDAAALRGRKAADELGAEDRRVAEARAHHRDRSAATARDREQRAARVADIGPLNPADPAMVIAEQPAAAAQTDLVSALERLAALHAGGLLTDEEFGAAKAELLRRRTP
jgi:hypothetical protein